MSYTFLNASGVSVLAQSSTVGIYEYPIVFTSTLGANPVTLSGTVTTAGKASAISYVVRNDNVASALGVDLTYRVQASDSAGRTLTKPFAPVESSVFGHGSVNGAASVILISGQANKRIFVTDVWVANSGSVATIVNFTAGGGSILAKTIAPATSGSNLIGLNTPIAVPLGSPFNVEAVTAVSVLHGTAGGYITQ